MKYNYFVFYMAWKEDKTYGYGRAAACLTHKITWDDLGTIENEIVKTYSYVGATIMNWQLFDAISDEFIFPDPISSNEIDDQIKVKDFWDKQNETY